MNLLDEERQGISEQFAHLLDQLSSQERALPEDTICAFERLSAALRDCFAREDNMLATSRYPQHEYHAAAHRALLVALVSVCERFKADPKWDEIIESTAYVRDWWASHIDKADAEHAAFFSCPKTIPSGRANS